MQQTEQSALDHTLLSCPNPSCPHHDAAVGRWFIKKGIYWQRGAGRPIQRFQCRTCLTRFSESSIRDTYYQRKPYLNEHVYNWMTNSVSQRQIAKVLKISRTTVSRKVAFLAEKIERIHACKTVTGELQTEIVQFDEQETFIVTKQRPVSIALAVDGTHDGTGGKIISFEVALMPARGRNAHQSQEHYGHQPDNRAWACQTVLNNVKLATAGSMIDLVSDGKPAYRTYVRDILPWAAHIQVVNGRQEIAGRREGYHENLWWLNQTCGHIRHCISRMRRRSCVTTKSLEWLRCHLWLFVAARNRYQSDLWNPLFDELKFKNIKKTIDTIRADLMAKEEIAGHADTREPSSVPTK